MSADDRLLTDADVKALAEAFSAAMVARLKDEKTVNELSGAWSHHVDRLIGRGVRRFAVYVSLVGIIVGAVKWEVIKFTFFK